MIELFGKAPALRSEPGQPGSGYTAEASLASNAGHVSVSFPAEASSPSHASIENVARVKPPFSYRPPSVKTPNCEHFHLS